jgi:cbb3-type cytochrome oxidase subunit 1
MANIHIQSRIVPVKTQNIKGYSILSGKNKTMTGDMYGTSLVSIDPGTNEITIAGMIE